MAYARATYPGGGFQTDVSGTSGIGFGGGGSPFGDMGWLMELARRRAMQQLDAGDIQNQMLSSQAEGQDWQRRRMMGPQLSGEYDPNRQGRIAAEREGLRAQQAQAQAMYQPAPTKMQWGFNMMPGRVMGDPHMMSGAQRQMFLPQASQEVFLGGPNIGKKLADQQAVDFEGAKQIRRYLGGGYGGQQPIAAGGYGGRGSIG